MDQNLHQSLSRAEPDENRLPNQKINKPSSAATDHNGKGCFDCNICLDSAQEPVVTLCGHLYCWPCIYKWLHVQNSSSSVEADNEPNCPVCKAQISQSSLIPLHGRGTPSEQDHRRLQMDMPLPRRPLPDSMPRNHPNNQLQPPLLLPNNNNSSTAGMCGEMLFARMFGPGTGLFPHPYANTYPVPVRRPETRVHKSLNRVSIFLFSCILLCLLLF